MTSVSSESAAAATVDKAVDILFHLHACGSPQGVSEIGRALGMPRSSAHRLLASLTRRGLVERSGQGRYQPGIALLALGLGVLDREPLVAAARPVLEDEAEELGETFFVVGSRAGEIAVFDKVEGSGFLRAAPRVGSIVPVHATAVGKLFLAFAPELVTAPAGRLEAFTPQTAVDAGALRAAVAETKLRRWASNRDEWIEGLSVLAAPVFAREKMVGAVALAMASPRLAELGEEPLGRRVVAAAGRVTARMSGGAR